MSLETDTPPSTESSPAPPRYFAHSLPDRPDSAWQPLAQHLTAVARLASESAAVFSGSELAAVQGLLHDVGKYCEPFQRKLRGESLQVDHSTRGAQIVAQRYGPLGQLLAYGKSVRELAPKPVQLFQKLERVRVRHAGVLSDDALAAEMRSREQVKH